MIDSKTLTEFYILAFLVGVVFGLVGFGFLWGRYGVSRWKCRFCGEKNPH